MVHKFPVCVGICGKGGYYIVGMIVPKKDRTWKIVGHAILSGNPKKADNAALMDFINIEKEEFFVAKYNERIKKIDQKGIYIIEIDPKTLKFTPNRGRRADDFVKVVGFNGGLIILLE